MALTLEDATRNAMGDAFDSEIGGSGKLKLKNGATVISETTLGTTSAFEAWGTGTAGQGRLIGDDDTNVVSGGNPLTFTGNANAGAGTDVQTFELTTSADAVVASGTVTATSGGGDIELDNVNLADGQNGTLTSFVVTVPAS